MGVFFGSPAESAFKERSNDRLGGWCWQVERGSMGSDMEVNHGVVSLSLSNGDCIAQAGRILRGRSFSGMLPLACDKGPRGGFSWDVLAAKIASEGTVRRDRPVASLILSWS